jgi:protein-tyrosine-phosphatase
LHWQLFEIADGRSDLRQMSHGQIDVASPGSASEPEIHPIALQALATLGISMADQYPKSLQRFLGDRFDYVITVCDRSAERRPDLSGDLERIQWSFDDPVAAIGTVEERQRAFNNIAAQLVNRVRIWMSLPSIGGRGRL